MPRLLVCALLTVVGLVAGVSSRAQEFTVRITVARANVRAGPSLTSTVIARVSGGTILTLKRIEGDWLRVELPPNSELGGARVEAYVSNTVAVVESTPLPSEPAEAPAVAPPPAPAEPSAESPSPPAETITPVRDGMSVALQIGVSTAWLTPEVTSLRTIASAIRSLRDLTSLPADGAPEPGPATSVTYVWIADGAAAGQIVPNRRPSFVVVFKEVPGVRPEDIEPYLVRVTPVGSAGRAVAFVRARADRVADRELSWNLMREIEQDEIRTSRQDVERGIVRIQPSSDLEPGEYAVVVRPREGWRLAGASVLSESGEGRLFRWTWGFSIRE